MIYSVCQRNKQPQLFVESKQPGIIWIYDIKLLTFTAFRDAENMASSESVESNGWVQVMSDTGSAGNTRSLSTAELHCLTHFETFYAFKNAGK